MVYSLRCRACHAATNPAGPKKTYMYAATTVWLMLCYGKKPCCPTLLCSAYLATTPPAHMYQLCPVKDFDRRRTAQHPGHAILPHCLLC